MLAKSALSSDLVCSAGGGQTSYAAAAAVPSSVSVRSLAVPAKRENPKEHLTGNKSLLVSPRELVPGD